MAPSGWPSSAAGVTLNHGKPLCLMRSFGRLAQLVRAPASHAGGRRFESYSDHHHSSRHLLDLELGCLPYDDVDFATGDSVADACLPIGYETISPWSRLASKYLLIGPLVIRGVL